MEDWNIRLSKFKLRQKMELLWMHCYSSPGKRFAFNNKSYIKNFHECWSVFSKRYTFSASEGFFGVFNPFLGITVLSKSDRVEFLNFFYIYLLHTILQILAKDTCNYGAQWDHWPVDMIRLLQFSLTEFSSSLMMAIKQ